MFYIWYQTGFRMFFLEKTAGCMLTQQQQAVHAGDFDQVVWV